MHKTAIVTGGSRGIGYAIVRKLLSEWYNVVIMHRHESDTIRKNLKALEGVGSFACVQGDISIHRDRQRCIETAVNTYGRIDVLVNNAGVAPLDRMDLLEMSEGSFDRVIAINLKAAMFLTQLAAKQMIAQEAVGHKKGTIINIGSISSDTVSLNRGEYCVSKAGMSMLTQLYAARLAGEGIYVYEVRPGIIATDMTAGVHDKYDGMIAQGVFPVKRWGRPEDVANAVSLFCSDQLPYSTGEVIHVDGGFHIRRL